MVEVLVLLLLADAAIETYVSGSSTRWIAVSGFACYVGACLVLRGRVMPRTLACAGLLTLLVMLAAGAWMPGGLEQGIRLAGLSTSTLVGLCVAASVAGATLVVVRAGVLPQAVRVLSAVLASSAVVALLHAIISGRTFRALIAGSAATDQLSLLVRWMMLAGLVMLPLGIVVLVVRAGLRRPAAGSSGRSVQQLTALGACLGMLLAAWPTENTPAEIADRVASSAQRQGGDATRLETALTQLARGSRETSRDRWDSAYVVQALGNDPQVIFNWVRDNTHWVPYRGVLRGATGVLMDRQGSSLDRALLLAQLLEKAGHEVRLANAELLEATAQALLNVLDAPNAGVPDELLAAPERKLEQLAVEYSVDGQEFSADLAAQAAGLRQVLATLDERVESQTARLLAAIGERPVSATDPESAIEVLRQHWWVQQLHEGHWRDLDLLASDDAIGRALTEPSRTIAPAQLEDSLQHRLSIRVVVERWKSGTLTEAKLLETGMRASEMIGRPVLVQFWPADSEPVPAPTADPREAFLRRTVERKQWIALMSVGDEVIAQTTIDEAGDPVVPRGGGLGGLGSAISGAVRPDASGTSVEGQLTAARIEYEIWVPGRPSRVVRRPIFDLVGPARRLASPVAPQSLDRQQRLDRALALMGRTEIVVLPCQVAPEFVAHLAAESLAKNADLLRALTTGGPIDDADMKRRFDSAAPPVSPLYTLALARLEWSQTGDQVYIDRPLILSRHRVPAMRESRLALIDATDIVTNEIAVDRIVRDPFRVRLQQGVLDTNAEALLQGNTVSNTADAFARAGEWRTLTTQNQRALSDLSLPRDAVQRVVEELDAGMVVVAPSRRGEGEDAARAGWWRIDPSTGDTLGVGINGWGQAMSERSVMMHPLLEMAKTFAFDYAFCQAVPQVLNATVPFLRQHQAELPWVTWLPEAGGKSAGQVYSDNKRECLLGAMITTGITATLPLILMTIRYRQMARLVRTACFAANTLVATAAGTVAIQDVRAGDLVWSRDPDTGEQRYQPVTRVFVNFAKPVLLLNLRDSAQATSTLRVTPNHPLWVQGRGWARADELGVGDRLRTQSGEMVEWVSSRRLARATVYNLEVAAFHTYFAGPDAIWAHNACRKPPVVKPPWNGVWIKRELYQDLQRLAGLENFKKFIAAMSKGMVGPTAESGIKPLYAAVRGYNYELKIGGSPARLLGKIDGNGILILEEFVPAGLH